ncbi:CRISPR-associated endonuclease Cas6 [Algoriphagus chordae]|uniref:DNA repair protein n=1 Tax=Algoriphagus chordae TaxID=237019 RepID=A0A2W7SCE9_9BACT|nr:CRISPR-associated endonuclease Cas6 [Algoriphagus chordae]PZX48292.1 hypothetical protein LV85_03702 [Algoriphagus chordae]
MPIIKVIKITFDTNLKSSEIPKFRGAVVEVVGRQNVAFHNHISDSQFAYSYPVIQYKTTNGKASIVCIHDGVDEIHEFFTKNTGRVRIGSQFRPLMVESMKINSFDVGLTSTSHRYQINDWLALNEINHIKYQELEGISEKVQFLERMLIGNLLSFAKGINWTVGDPIILKITDIPSESTVKHKGIKFQSFSLSFKTNMYLPPDIGLGKGASMGWGTINKPINL